jgi:hypothetical protein
VISTDTDSLEDDVGCTSGANSRSSSSGSISSMSGLDGGDIESGGATEAGEGGGGGYVRDLEDAIARDQRYGMALYLLAPMCCIIIWSSDDYNCLNRKAQVPVVVVRCGVMLCWC